MADDTLKSAGIAALAIAAAAAVGVATKGADARMLGKVDVTEAPVAVAVDLSPPKGERLTKDSPLFQTAKDSAQACACSTGTDCVQWAPVDIKASTMEPREAPRGVTLMPGMWRGPGCLPVPCVALLGEPLRWPAACLAPDGGAL